MGHVLYSFRRCPYAMRGRLGLHASALPFEHREIILRNKPAHMLENSPKGTVPVLITSEGRVIDESLDIALWALGQNDPYNWMAPEWSEIERLITINDGMFKYHLDRYKYPSRYADAPRSATDPEHREAALTILKDYETRLSQSPYLLGSDASLADIAIFPFIRQFANTDRDWWDNYAEIPHIQAWLDRWLASDIFLGVMKKHPLWVAP